MSSSGSPLSVVRRSMWGFLLFAGAAWLAIGWTVLRLGPGDLARVTGPVILFGALTEAGRALAGTRTWWLNAGLAVLFTATGLILLLDTDSSFTTAAALLGWYLLVRGACDVAVAMMTRETDRIWGLLLVAGLVEAGLGYFAAGPAARTGEAVVLVLGALGVIRGVADLVAALRLREVSAARPDILDLPPERAAGVAGYSAGLTDFEAAPARSGPKHRAAVRLPGSPAPVSPAAGAVTASGSGSASASGMSALSAAESGAPASAAASPDAPEAARDVSATAAGQTASGPASGVGDDFHAEVLRTTADLDAMLALAGVTGAAVGHRPEDHDVPPVPDTPEGVETAGDAGLPATSAARTEQQTDPADHPRR